MNNSTLARAVAAAAEAARRTAQAAARKAAVHEVSAALAGVQPKAPTTPLPTP